MNDVWRRFLEERGARIEPSTGAVLSFGDPANEARAAARDGAIVDLSSRGVLRARGEEGDAFLQGQLTNDLEELDEESHGLGAYCSVKGRVISVFRIFPSGGAWHFVLPRDVLGLTREKLELYRMRAQVTFEDASDALVGAGVVGERPVAALERTLGELPRRAGQARHAGGLSILRIEGEPPRFELIGESGEIEKIWRSVEAEAPAAGPAAWGLLDVRAGVPFVTAATSEAFLPQMLSLERIGGVSFEKGCFPGQEVVARTQHLGAVKRRLYHARIQGGGTLPVSGAALRAMRDGSERDGGRVLAAYPSPDHGAEMLAVVPVAEAEGADEIRLGSAEGGKIELLDDACPTPGGTGERER
ncbi:MAG: folate-binding protein [Acidobacteriota bacterium]|nr:folate-binding protein [Acidobacteriota bacterium]